MTLERSNPTGTIAAGTGPKTEPRPWRRAILWLAFLGPFFFASYGLANYLASQRSDVGAVVFAWESRIPFVPWTIIPYWSIDLLYAISVFLCTSRIELDTHARRLLTCQIGAVACFILFPLRFTFGRPDMTGMPGFMFDALASFDKPFNQAPSLHIALLVVLWVVYARHVPRWLVWPLHLWMALIGASVLTTYQHHFFDLPTGAALGFFALWLWPDSVPSPLTEFRRARDPRRRALALYYALGAALMAAAASAIGGWGWWLFWPAFSLTLVAANYAFLGPGGFEKGPDGRMTFGAIVLLLPYLLAAGLNGWLWRRGQAPAAEIRDSVHISGLPRRAEAARFATVIDLCAELPATAAPAQCQALPMLDLATPEPDRLREAARLIEQARARGPVLVCCALGFSRSAAAIATWLAIHHRYNGEDAIGEIRRAWPHVRLKMAARAAIDEAAGRTLP
jgi:protein-tyrosine phosphatase/membrane-associated phospholipid phosphatase